jgi:hypothetical protein
LLRWGSRLLYFFDRNCNYSPFQVHKSKHWKHWRVACADKFIWHYIAGDHLKGQISCPFATFLKKFTSYSSGNDWVQRKVQYFAIWFNSGRFIIDIQQLQHGLSKVLKTSIFSQVVQLRSKKPNCFISSKWYFESWINFKSTQLTEAEAGSR